MSIPPSRAGVLDMAGEFLRLLHQDFSDLEAAAKSWQKLADKCLTAQRESGKKVSGPLHDAGWEGTSADYGLAALEAVESMLGTGHTNVQLVASVLDTACERMQSAKRKLRNAVKDAESAGHKVLDSGRVEPISASDAAGGGTPSRFLVEDANSALAGFQNRINQALEAADTANHEGTRALVEIDPFELDKQYGAEEALKDAQRVADFMGIDPKGLPDGDSPKENAKWWNGLDEDEQRIYLAAYPEKVGWLDGLPSSVRDQANRTVLDVKLNELNMRAENGSLGYRDRFMLDSMNKLKDRLDKADVAPAEKQLLLLGIDPEKRDGRAIVAMGDPDTADHTAVLVPGTATDLSSMPGQIDRIDKMQHSASASSNGESVSVISWLGYDAPEIDGSVATPGRAEDGAADLRRFADGTRVAQGEERSHLTVVGHSYGSTTVGTAASGGNGLGADDIISLGSPGMNVKSADELQIDPQHVWVGATQTDPIVRNFGDMTLGKNPAVESFGAQSMAVNGGGHSSYWDDGGESLRNQGRVIGGANPTTGEYYHHRRDQVNPTAPDGTNPLVIG